MNFNEMCCKHELCFSCLVRFTSVFVIDMGMKIAAFNCISYIVSIEY